MQAQAEAGWLGGFRAVEADMEGMSTCFQGFKVDATKGFGLFQRGVGGNWV